MHRFTIVAALSAGLFGLALDQASAQTRSRVVNRAETGLVGIKLYDSGITVLNRYGTPSSIEAVGFGGSSVGPVGSGPGPSGGGGARGGGAGGGAAAALGHRPSGGGDFGFANDLLLQGSKLGGMAGGDQGGGELTPNPSGGGGARPSAGGGGGAMGGGSGSNERILYTRWVYNRTGSKYAFIIDKSNRVVQIEAIGISDSKVRTNKGTSFGASFAQVMRAYSTPEGYEIKGDNIMVRFLQRNKVAFRLSRLGPNKPHVVTGIVVAGGKT
jgi:hypothetical protein